MIAALFVEERGGYFGNAEIDPWPEKRDARLYAGPWPVVAHPPCSRWCRLAGLVEARWGHKRGDDGGCFASALASVRKWGGVLEHPAYSDAWKAFGLARPDTGENWKQAGPREWTCYVEQWRYGHQAKKATWLYYVGDREPFPLIFGSIPDRKSTALVSWCGNHVSSGETRPRLGKKAAAATPPLFRDTLIALARWSNVRA